MIAEATSMTSDAPGLAFEPAVAPTVLTGKRVSLGTWWRTVREFKSGQVLHLVRRRLWPTTHKIKRVRGRKELRQPGGPVPFPEWQPETARVMVETRTFTFMNATARGLTGIPWASKKHGLLWTYNLNYCDFLNLDLTAPSDELLLRSALNIALDWIRRNSSGSETGWMPYPLSLRIVNWLKFLLRNLGRLQEIGEENGAKATLRSLADQTATLRDRLEADLLANHFLKNVKALLFAAALIECAATNDWWQTGERYLGRELKAQVLSDGGHFERSLMYHSQVLEDLIDISYITRSAGRPLNCARLLNEKIAKMAAFLNAVLHPDGGIPLFNDSTLSGARHARELIRIASSLSGSSVGRWAPTTALSATGYAVLRHAATGSALIFDCGPVGPDFNPGHAHADVLSYELSLHDQRVIVDTGVSTYEPTVDRHYERSTAAHNTVRIDGEEQAEVWASFRVGRRPRVGAVTAGEVSDLRFVRGQHFAYRRRGVSHTRVIVRTPDGTWLVMDWLEGGGSHRVESFVHLHPSVQVRSPEARTADTMIVSVGSYRYRLISLGPGDLQLLKTWYAPEFGIRQPRTSISWSWRGAFPVMLAYALVPSHAAIPRIRYTPDQGTVSVNGALVPIR
jgi:uncharacterized heparinase superfamily protein